MKIKEFMNMKVFDYEDDITHLNIGDIFIMGEHMEEQKSAEFIVNDESSRFVSYYEVLSKKGRNVNYIVKIEKLEEK